MFERELDLEFSYHMVAELKGGGIGGYVFCWRAGPEANVMTLAVRSDLRRQGLGSWILQKTLDELENSGIKGVWLEVRPGNLAARSLYRSFGFQEVGIRPKYYYDTGEDAIVMKKELGK
jgi:ribosomal-protein-alanine N-acetyltransferase